LPKPLWHQLAEGGRMVIPLGAEPDGESLWLLHKEAGQIRARNLGEVRFVPLVSPILQDPAQWLSFA
jgi:protein-L-isoaspartate(D-aspartate) O-methyltransferase